MSTSSVHKLVAIVALALTVGYADRAVAQGSFERLNTLAIAVEVALSLANAGTAAAEVVYIAKGERYTSLWVASVLLGLVGVVAGIPAVGADSDGVHAAGITSVATGSLNIVLAAVHLLQPFGRNRRDYVLAPVTLVDASGQLSVGAGLTGRF